MKLQVNGIRCGDCIRSIVDALLRLDLGARINFNLDAHVVRVEGRLTPHAAATAIEQGGFEVAAIVDTEVVDAAFRTRRGDAVAM